MRAFGSWVVGMAMGCVGPTAPNVEDPPVEVVDTGFPPGELARIHVDFGDGQLAPLLSAAFLEADVGPLNFPGCGLRNPDQCLVFFPDVEEVPVEVSDPALPSPIETLQHAESIEVAGFTLPWVERGAFGHYALELAPDDPLPVGTVEATWSGRWDQAFAGEVLGDVRGPLVLTSPEPSSSIPWPPDGIVTLEWVPNVEGIVTLDVETADGAVRYRLENDSFFEVDTSQLDLDFTAGAMFRLRHWQRDVQLFRGHVIEASSSSEGTFTVQAP